MNDEQPPPLPQPTEPPLPGPEPPPLPGLPPPAPERDPFWGYSDLILFAGLAIPSMLLGLGVVNAANYLLRVHAPNPAAEQLAVQSAAYAFLFGALTLILRVQYGQPFWRSLGWQ